MRKRSITFAVASGLVALSLAVLPGVALARDADTSSGTGSNSSETEHQKDPVTTSANENETETETETKDSTKTSTTERSGKRLDAVKLKVCRNREKSITKILGSSAERAQKQYDLFTTIANRVEAFYTSKGKTVANYDELVAAVNTARAQVQADISALKQTGTFTCSADDPVGQIALYKASLEKVRKDLKDYRTAVKNLIVGVRSAQGEESSNAR